MSDYKMYQTLLDKLQNQNDMTIAEKKEILKLYYIMIKNETLLCDLVYSFHGCDSWEDIFRDYNEYEIESKADGILIAIRNMEEIYDGSNPNPDH